MEKEMAKVIHLWGTGNPLCAGDQFCMQVCVGFCTQPNAWFCMQILFIWVYLLGWLSEKVYGGEL